jgi:hypothetical protein
VTIEKTWYDIQTDSLDFIVHNMHETRATLPDGFIVVPNGKASLLGTEV